MANNSVVTQQKLQEFYNTKVYPYLNGATHTGFTPVGTVISYFGETAPEYFLICDGTEYAKSDYPQLADLLLNLTDPTPYEGSDSDHFKVPDLRGEFLRGTGTNGHTNQGNGANVGIHQDGTRHPFFGWFDGGSTPAQNEKNVPVNPDYDSGWRTTSGGRRIFSSSISSGTDSKEYYISRPTNTSVLYCIAYKNIYIDLALDSFPLGISNPTDGQLLMYDATAGRWVNGGHKYSTDEHIVGTWIDGKPIYEKTFTLQSSIFVTSSWFDTGINLFNLNVKDIVDIHTVNTRNIESDLYGNIHFFAAGYKPSDSHNLLILSLRNGDSSTCIINTIILQYTKTTDTV